jgi:hypothetical protein
MRTGKLVKSQKSKVAHLPVHRCFDLEANTEHESNGNLVFRKRMLWV